MFRRMLVVVLVFMAVLVGIGYVLPTEYSVARTIQIPATPQVVFPHIADLRAWSAWDPWKLRDPSITSTYSEGSTAVPGAWEKWKSEESGKGRRVIREVDPPKKVRVNLTHGEGEDVARMIFHLKPAEQHTDVVWMMQGETGRAPIARWIGVMMDGLVGPDLEFGLQRLKKAVVDAAGADG